MQLLLLKKKTPRRQGAVPATPSVQWAQKQSSKLDFRSKIGLSGPRHCLVVPCRLHSKWLFWDVVLVVWCT